MDINAVDLFCGAGGLTRGLRNVGIDVRAGYDIETQCEYPYETNNNADFVEGDLADDISLSEIESRLNDADTDYTLIAGCAPCQPFSPMSNGNSNSGENHEKWGLMDEFGDIVADVEPDLVTMENVPAVEGREPYENFCEQLNSLGYKVADKVVECPDYGVPQQRKRMVLLASQHGEISVTDPTHNPDCVTVASALREKNSVAELSAGETAAHDPLHSAANLSETNLERIEKSKPGGTWHDWPDDLRLACHKKDSGRKYTAAYGRMEWDDQAPTMTTQFYNYGSGRFGHPEENRAITLREGALLQTFPKDYEFAADYDDIKVKSLGKMIGNAVPVKLAEAIGESLLDHVGSV